MARRLTDGGQGARSDDPAGIVRCAVYTRKSTEEGLEQAFNSLDAQYEACTAYIASQRHEGWRLAKDRYDDGGFSGGNIERPGLKRLLADVAARRVQVIVLYKIDRLTRSLADFAKIVEVLDAAGASFVSVTQSFNTTTSMGRLTLNMLLSFAQFEREVTGERIRDKIAASKAKGMWMGGPAPLGYDVKDRMLVINEAEAATVRHIFTRYVALASGQALVDELRAQGYRTKQRAYADGGIKGGIAFGRGMLFHLLQNRLYNGEVEHKGSVYAGEHDAIVDRGVWDAVQQLIAGNRIERRVRNNASAPSLLSGLIVDGDGRRMSPSHAVKSGRRYRYYITHVSMITDDKAAWRMPAHPLERAVIDQLVVWLGDRQAIATIVGPADAAATAFALARAKEAVKLLHGSTTARRELIASIVGMIRLSDSDLQIDLKADAMTELLRVAIVEDAALTISAPLTRVRRGKEIKLVIGNDAGVDAQSGRDERLVALLSEAREARETLLAHADRTLTAHAAATGQCRKRLGQLVGLSYLAPGIQRAIITGRQRAMITPIALLRARVPITWDEQKATLGLAEATPS